MALLLTGGAYVDNYEAMSPVNRGTKRSPARSGGLRGDSRTVQREKDGAFYDLYDERYISLEEIAEFVKVGVGVLVIDEETQHDLTALTLSQIIINKKKYFKKHFARRRFLRLKRRGLGAFGLDKASESDRAAVAAPLAAAQEEADQDRLIAETYRELGRMMSGRNSVARPEETSQLDERIAQKWRELRALQEQQAAEMEEVLNRSRPLNPAADLYREVEQLLQAHGYSATHDAAADAKHNPRT